MAWTLAIAGCGDNGNGSEGDPAAVLADYEETRNTGDVDALMSFYADDAVVTNHPQDSHSLGEDEPVATGVVEIRILEFGRPAFQRSEDATEFFNIESSGDVVTFDQRFFNNSGDCFGNRGSEVTVEGDKFTLYAWGTQDDSLCE